MFTNLQFISNKRFLIIAFLVILTIFLRINRLEDTFSFHAEYNYKLWAIKEIAFDHKLRLIGIEAVSYLHHLHYPPLALYIFSPLLIFTQGNPLSIELFLIVLNGLNVVLVFKLAKALGSNRLAFYSSILYSSSFYVQRHDRFIWVVGPIITFCLIYFLLANKILGTAGSKKLFLFLLGIIVGLALSFHFQAALLIPLSLILILMLPDQKKIKNYSILLLGLILPVAPLIIFEFRHEFYNLQGVLLLVKDSSSSASPILERVVITIKTLGDIPIKILTSIESIPHKASFLSFILQTMIFLFILPKFKSTPKILKLITCLFVLGFLTFPFVQNKYYAVNYYLIILIPLYLLGISYLVVKLIKNQYLFLGLLSIFLLINLNRTFQYKPALPYKDQKQALEWIVKNAPHNHFEIKFKDFRSEEFDFLLFHLAKKNEYPYEYIHYVEPWHESQNPDFIISGSGENSSVNFGQIFVKETSK